MDWLNENLYAVNIGLKALKDNLAINSSLYYFIIGEHSIGKGADYGDHWESNC
jgi:hypothetical protein